MSLFTVWKRCRVLARRYWREFLREEPRALTERPPVMVPGPLPIYLCPGCCRHRVARGRHVFLDSPTGRRYLFCQRCAPPGLGKLPQHAIALCGPAVRRADAVERN